jgi:cell volume regulation protein A
VALVLMLVARPAAVFLCLAPFKYQWREKLFISWVGLRGAVAIFLASIPLLVGLPGAYLYFDVAFVVVLSSLLIQGWTVALSARKLGMSFARSDPLPRRVELDLPGQLAREIVGYPVPANSPYLRRGLIPNWARPTLVIRKEEILTPAEAEPVRVGDYVYLLAPPEKAQALDRFFMNMPPPRVPEPELLGDFFVAGTAPLGALAEIYGLQVAADHSDVMLADLFAEKLGRQAKSGDIVQVGPIALLAHKVENGRVSTVGLRLAEPEASATLPGRAKTLLKRVQKWIG